MPAQNDVEMSSVSSPDAGVGTIDEQGDRRTIPPNEILSCNRHNLEEEIRNLTQKIEAMTLQLHYHDQTIAKLSKRKFFRKL